MSYISYVPESKFGWEKKLGIFAVIWMVLSSGGILLNSPGYVNYVLLFDALLVVFLFIGASNVRGVIHRKEFAYVSLLSLVVALSMVANQDFASLLSYGRLILVLMLSMSVSLILERRVVFEVFTKTVLIIALISDFFYYFDLGRAVGGWFPPIPFRQHTYINSLVYVNIDGVGDRNFGIYIEPGLFQIYLNFAFLLVLVSGVGVIKRYFAVAVLMLALYATKSTTGYIVAVIIIAGQAFSSKGKGKWSDVFRTPIRIFVIAFIVGSIVSSAFFVENLESKFLYESQASYITRANSTLIDRDIILANPVFGLGVGNYQAAINEYDANGLEVDSASNTFTQLGALLGLPFIFLVVFGVFRTVASLDVAFWQKVLLILLYAVCFSTEPFILYPLFYLPVFMWFKKIRFR